MSADIPPASPGPADAPRDPAPAPRDPADAPRDPADALRDPADVVGGPADAARDPADEILDVVDEHDTVVAQVPRGDVYARGLRHRCVFVEARDAEGRVFVHRRTPTKLVFPSLYDMFVGGVVGAGESYDDAALREAEEELGVTGLPRPVPLFTFLYDDGAGRSWWSAVYEVRCPRPVDPQAEEVAWHGFLSDEELAARVEEWQWVPDGLAAYERLRALRAHSSPPGG
ncbi:NUDIX domain-containing protein [Streptomyces sp. p1417]|uniref:NUDIX domain-containing protein n=1 Tax=Streptomyces typhae TaxID=2681492 RepID=A0A6L6X8F1_9ACTN|nr:NUDIX domain-containing protein [Streptomyces typhae]MVO89649.1 NUDIX domain-containing protein [Streptomyces typhae]